MENTDPTPDPPTTPVVPPGKPVTPPQKTQPPGGSSDGTGFTPPSAPGTGPLPAPDNPGDDTGGPGHGGLDEGTVKDLDGGDERKEEEPSWRDNAWIQGAGSLFRGLGRVIGIGRDDSDRQPVGKRTVGVVVGVGVESAAVGLGVIVDLPAVAIGTVLAKTGCSAPEWARRMGRGYRRRQWKRHRPAAAHPDEQELHRGGAVVEQVRADVQEGRNIAR